MTKLIPAAGYLRMSSDKQETSIDDQRSELIAYAAKRGFVIVEWYADEGISGWKNKQRIGFQRLIADAPGGTFKVILCWDQSRFSRFDPIEANYYWHQLRQVGVTIETVKEGKLDFETLGGWLTASVQQHGKNDYCRSLAADSARGRRKRVLEGKWTCPPPYGYRLENGVLALGDAEKVETVRRIFRLRASGKGFRSIAGTLNREGVASPHNKSWQTRQLCNMLKRETYLGRTVIGKEPTGKFSHVVEQRQTIENTHPPIIDAELWQAVQAVTDGRTRRVIPGRRPKTGGQLSGLIHCGRCGCLMYSIKAKGGYVCGSYFIKGSCSYNRLPHDVALKAVADKVRSAVLLGGLDALTAAIERVIAKRQASRVQIDVDALRKQIAEIDRKLQGAAARLLEVEPSLVKSVRQAMLDLQTKRESLAERMTTATASKRQPKSAKEIAAKLWELDRVLREGEPDTVRAALSQIIDRVEIDFDYQPMKGNPARKRFSPAGGTIHFCTKRDMSRLQRTSRRPAAVPPPAASDPATR